MIKDAEDLLRSIHSHVKSNLNTKITAINTEKANFTVATIASDDDHYIFGGALLDLPNRVFVNFVIIDKIITTNNYNDMVLEVSLLIEVVFDNPKRATTYFESLRYMRALYETMLEYEGTVKEVGGAKIIEAYPMDILLNKRQLVMSGVNVSIALA